MLTKVGNCLFWNQISGKRRQETLSFLAAISKISIKNALLALSYLCALQEDLAGSGEPVSAQTCLGSSEESDR